jgi:hypothetical protein
MPRGRWSSFIAPAAARGRVVRQLHEESNPHHRLRVEYDAHTLLIHLSDEEGPGWTTFAVSRTTRHWVGARGPRQIDAASTAYSDLERKMAKSSSKK